MISNAIVLLATGASPGVHIRVNGDGYLRFAEGRQAIYAQEATLSTTSGYITTAEGYPLLPPIKVAANSGPLKIGIDGTILIAGKLVGHIVLASFGKPLTQRQQAYYVAAGKSMIGYPGEGTFGVIEGGTGSGSAAPSVRQRVIATTAAEPQGQIVVAAHTDVVKEHILLGDIATITGVGAFANQIANTDLGPTPMYGAQRGITEIYILSKLRNEGLKTDGLEIQCPYGANVLRKGQSVEPDQIVAAAVEAAKSKLGIDYALRCDRNLQAFFVNCGELKFVDRDANPSGDGATVTLEVDVDGKPATTRTIYLVPTVPLPMVRFGDPIKIQVSKNGAVVEIAGKAKSTAKVGATISVESESGAEFSGILRTPSLVEVKL